MQVKGSLDGLSTMRLYSGRLTQREGRSSWGAEIVSLRTTGDESDQGGHSLSICYLRQLS